MKTTSPGCNCGTNNSSRNTRSTAPLMAPSMLNIARRPSKPNAPITEMLGPGLHGAAQTARSPRKARAKRRVIPQCIPISSTKIKRRASKGLTCSPNAVRAWRTRSLWRSLSISVFFSTQFEFLQGSCHGGRAHLQRLLDLKMGLQFGQRGIGLLLHPRPQHLARRLVEFGSLAARVPQRRNMALFPPLAQQLLDEPRTHAEQLRNLLARAHLVIYSRHDALAQLNRISFHEAKFATSWVARNRKPLYCEG